MHVQVGDPLSQDVVVYDLDTRQPILGCFDANDETGEYSYYDTDDICIQSCDLERLTRTKIGNIKILFVDRLVDRWEKSYLP